MIIIQYPLSDEEKRYIEPFKKKAQDLPVLINEVFNVYFKGFEIDPYIPIEIDFNLKQSLNSMTQENTFMFFEDFWLRYLDKNTFTKEQLLVLKMPYILQEIEGSLKHELSYIGYNLYRIRGEVGNYYDFITYRTKAGKIKFKNFSDIVIDSKNKIPIELQYLNNIFTSFVDRDIVIGSKKLKFTQFRNCLAHNKYIIKSSNGKYYLILNNNGEYISMEMIEMLPHILVFQQLTKALRCCTFLSLNRVYPLTGIDLSNHY